MASIYKVERKNGTAYRAVIRRKDYPTISKTFNRKKDAVQWAREYDQEARLQKIYADRKGANRTVGELIDHYMYQYTGRDKTRVTRLSWWKERIGGRWLRTVDAETIDNALDELRNTPALRSNGSRLVSLKRPRSEATINIQWSWGHRTSLPRQRKVMG